MVLVTRLISAIITLCSLFPFPNKFRPSRHVIIDNLYRRVKRTPVTSIIQIKFGARGPRGKRLIGCFFGKPILPIAAIISVRTNSQYTIIAFPYFSTNFIICIRLIHVFITISPSMIYNMSTYASLLHSSRDCRYPRIAIIHYSTSNFLLSSDSALGFNLFSITNNPIPIISFTGQKFYALQLWA